MDSISIQGLKVTSLIGVYAFEREQHTELVVDVELGLDLRQPGQTDDVADTVDYAAVAELLSNVAKRSEFQLLEALAEAMISALFRQFAIRQVALTLVKPGILAQAERVAVRLVRER